MKSRDPKNVNETIFSIPLVLSDAWVLFKRYSIGFIFFTLIIFVINAILFFVPVVGILALLFLNPAFLGGYIIVAQRLKREEKVNFKLLFKGFRYTFALFTAIFVPFLIVILGLIIFVIPGLFIGGIFILAPCFVIFERKRKWQSLLESYHITMKNKMIFISLFGLMFLLNLAGAALFGLGLLVTIPFTYLTCFSAYSTISNHVISDENH